MGRMQTKNGLGICATFENEEIARDIFQNRKRIIKGHIGVVTIDKLNTTAL
jgi:hypothetical protein